MKIGVVADCFKKPIAESIALACELGLDGVQVYATSGEFSYDTLSENDKLNLKSLIKSNGLVFSALCGDMGGFGFEIEADNADRIAKTQRIIDLAAEFGAPAVTTHIGVIPENPAEPRFGVMQRALSECGRYAKSKGVTMAIETGPEKAATLLNFLKGTEGVGVNLDPANFVMVTGQNPVEAVYILKDYIVHTHAKDGVKLNDDLTPEQIYHGFAVGGVDALNACKSFKEVPLGEGSVTWGEYIAALKDIGYDGFLTIERECGDAPCADIKKAASFLKRII